MRTLTIVHALGPGGTERAAQNAALAFAAAGHDAAVLAYLEGGVRAGRLADAGIPVWIGGDDWEVVDRAIAAAVAWRPEAIEIHRGGNRHPVAGAVLRRVVEALHERPAVVETSHFARVDRSPDRALIDVHQQLSRWCMWKWRSWGRGLAPKPLGVVIPHMIDTGTFIRVPDDEIGAFREAHGLPAGAVVFGRVGQPSPASWSPMIFDAFAAVAAERPELHLLLVGLPEEDRPALERLPEPLRRRVVTLPFIQGDRTLCAAYGAIDCFLHASRCGESFGMVLCEAALCGTPAITLSTPLRGNTQLEVVGHERGGLVVSDLAGMIEAIQRIAGDPGLRRRFAEQGAAWVRQTCGIERVRDLHLALLETIRACAGDRDALAVALERDERFVTDVSSDEIAGLLDRCLGPRRRLQRLAMRLWHRPELDRLWASRHRSRWWGLPLPPPPSPAPGASADGAGGAMKEQTCRGEA